MTRHLNGVETEEQLIERNERYLRLGEAGQARNFVIEDPQHRVLGSIGAWHVEWHGQPAWETGWFVVPDAQGRGVASGALALLISELRQHRDGRRYLTAYPSTTNPGSNGVCRRGGFELIGTTSGSFRGAQLIMNEWAFDLDS